MAELPLAKDFPLAGEAAWQKLVEDALKGAPFASLRSKTHDGIEIEPLYPRAGDASVIPGRAAGVPWTVMQRADIADPETANKQILADLNNGATGLTLVFAGAIGDYGYALEATGAALSRALDGVYLDAGLAIELDLGRLSRVARGPGRWRGRDLDRRRTGPSCPKHMIHDLAQPATGLEARLDNQNEIRQVLDPRVLATPTLGGVRMQLLGEVLAGIDYLDLDVRKTGKRQ